MGLVSGKWAFESLQHASTYFEFLIVRPKLLEVISSMTKTILKNMGNQR